MDWYDCMQKYEDVHGARYLFDCQNCYICIYRARDSTLIGRFTRTQAKAFFLGLLNGKLPRDYDKLSDEVDSLMQEYNQAGVNWMVVDDYMSIREEYLYMKALSQVISDER